MLGIWTLFALSTTAGAFAAEPTPENHRPVLAPDGQDVAVPSRHYDILALDLDLALDFPKRRIGGTATYTVQQLSEGDLVLDQVALDIKTVTVDGELQQRGQIPPSNPIAQFLGGEPLDAEDATNFTVGIAWDVTLATSSDRNSGIGSGAGRSPRYRRWSRR